MRGRQYEQFWGEIDAPRHDLFGRGATKALLNLAVMEIGRSVCFKKDGGDAPSPDPNIGIAAIKNAELGEGWLKFARDQAKVGNIRQEEMDEITKIVVDQQLATQEKTNERADEQWQQHQETFRPIEERVAKEAMEYDSPEKQAQAAAEARADVQKSAAMQQQTNNRQMAAMGINPNSGRFQGQARANELNTALAAAGSQNQARNNVRNMGIMMRKDAANFGRNMPGTAAQSYGLGINAGNSAVGNMATANNAWNQNNQIMAQGFQGAMQGYNNQANILQNQYNSQLNAWGTQQNAAANESAGMGSAIGAIAGIAGAMMM